MTHYKTVSATGRSYQYYWQVAMNAACHFNILTKCPKITFQILKIACKDSERFLNDRLAVYKSTEISTALCCCAVLGKVIFNYR